MLKYLVSLIAVCLLSVPLAGAVSVNDFTVTNYDIRYELGRDDTQRSTLRTTETITADFRNPNQNRGIERAIPNSYDGHPTSLQIKSVTKPTGEAWQYSTRSQNGNTVVRIGDPDTYVIGEQTYVITYEQRDVTRYYEDTESDEFYWDTNGTDWRVPIERLTVSIRVDDGLRTRLNDKTACYQGVAGSDGTCTLDQQGSTISTVVEDLSPGENVTIAVGFQKETFAAYTRPIWETLISAYLAISWIVGVVAVGLAIWFFARWQKLYDRNSELGTIVPEYLPPQVSVTCAASLQTNQGSTFTAQLLDLTVRHYLKLYEVKPKKWYRSGEYELEIVKDISDLAPEEQEILRDIFSGNSSGPQVGTRLNLKTLANNSSVYKQTLDNDKKLQDLVRGDYGLRYRDEAGAAWFKRLGKRILIFGVLLLNPMVLIVAAIAYVLAHKLWPLTDKGLALKRYLRGLKLYIQVAEAERLKLLQSPEGAAKVPSGTTDNPSELLKLYERTLPYAVLFGQEKQWSKQIGELYQQTGTSPDWYSSTTAFNAGLFAGAVSGFSSAASYSSANSSSSGGSSGGGSSGGGGGGGGGGGW